MEPYRDVQGAVPLGQPQDLPVGGQLLPDVPHPVDAGLFARRPDHLGAIYRHSATMARTRWVSTRIRPRLQKRLPINTSIESLLTWVTAIGPAGNSASSTSGGPAAWISVATPSHASIALLTSAPIASRSTSSDLAASMTNPSRLTAIAATIAPLCVRSFSTSLRFTVRFVAMAHPPATVVDYPAIASLK